MASAPALPSRLRGCPPIHVAAVPGLKVRVASTWRARLLGLAGLPGLAPGIALLLPRTRSVHTFGMRFTLDLVWLDPQGAIVRVDEAVPARRVRSCRRAAAVLELESGRRDLNGQLGT